MMKKIIMFLMLILLSSIVFAGNTYPLDFSKSNNYLVGVREGDRVEFNLNDERHTIIIDDIRMKNVDLTCFFNLDTENLPRYYTIGETIKGQNTKLKLDTDRNDVDDLFVWLESSDKEKAGLRIFKPINNKITGNFVSDISNKLAFKWIIFPIIAVVLLLLVILLKKNRRI